MMKRITAMLLALVVLTIAHAAENERGATLSATQLMEFIVEGYSGLQGRYDEVKTECDGILLRVDGLSRIADMDTRIIEMMRVVDDIQAVQAKMQDIEAVKNAAMGNIALLQRSATASAKDLTTVDGFGKNMKEWSHNMNVQHSALRHRLNLILKALSSLPPPQFFVNCQDMRFVLIRQKNGKSFYVSETPVTVEQYRKVSEVRGRTLAKTASDGYWTDMTLDKAQAFVKDLSTIEKEEYGMLTAAQVKYLKGYSDYAAPEIAVWLGNQLTVDLREQRQTKLFGIDMVEVWDPSGALRKEDDATVFGELPGAHYDKLGCCVVASVKVGKRVYFEQLRRRAEIGK